ncbi:MAG: hypothetical protein RSE14_04750 [Erythrobacter sp.]|jgi:hypothetical protein|uniref:hypothetical protein n=1 Tax=Erythrobacter sp. TaxID=1042 RepID=UPI002B47F7C3|nr:hypothetical protein [Erythrobacter sp.]WRH71411.1 MAG: hypothetical protein RSE14_04750 [Erythrobacter sp.]
MKAALPLLAIAALAACAPAAKAPVSAPAPVARPAPARPAPPPPQAPLASDWMDAALSPGAWIYQNFGEGMGRRALFSDPDDTFYFSLSCATGPEGRSVIFTRTGAPAKPDLAMTIRTETAQVTLPAKRFGAQITMASVSAYDPLLDAIALSKGRFAVEVEGETTLYLPTWAEVSRLVEDCRS